MNHGQDTGPHRERDHSLRATDLVLTCGGGPIGFATRFGDMMLITGGNGAGKTYFLKVLAGQQPPAAGWIERLASCQLFTADALRPADTCRDSLGLLVGPVVADLDPLASRFGLDLDSSFDRLSCGQRQRLLLVAAQATAAEVILLDSPTRDLDASGRELCIDLMLSLVSQGKTVIATTVDADLVVLLGAASLFEISETGLRRIRDAI